MKAYILCFIISITFTYIAELKIKKNKKRIGIFFLILALFTICIIAGLRDRTVGIDVSNYPLTIFKLYVEQGYSFIQVERVTHIEPLFSIIILISSIFKNFNITLFLIEFCCALPIFIYAYNKREKFSITFLIFIFLTTMYAKSFNLIRQFIAISWIVLSIYYFENKKYKKALFAYIIAILFHYTAVICIVAYFIIYILENYKNRENKRNWMIFIILIAIVFTLLFTVGLNSISKFLPDKYAAYIGSQYNISSFKISSLLKKLLWVVFSASIVCYYRKKDDMVYSEQLVYLMLLFIDIILYFMSLKVGTFGRLGYYFLYIAYFGMIPKIRDIFKQKCFISFVIISLLLVLWYNMTVVNWQADETYPYSSDVCDFLNENYSK